MHSHPVSGMMATMAARFGALLHEHQCLLRPLKVVCPLTSSADVVICVVTGRRASWRSYALQMRCAEEVSEKGAMPVCAPWRPARGRAKLDAPLLITRTVLR